MRKLLLSAIVPLLVLPWLVSATQPDSAPSIFVGWLDDDHWLQARDGRWWKVAALDGKEVEWADLGGLSDEQANREVGVGETLADRAALAVLAQKSGDYALLEMPVAGPNPLQQINQSALRKELSVASPDKKWAAICRKNDLYFVDSATKKETRITRDGSDLIFNGRADAVYQEEIFFPGRSLNAFWWSGDSKHLAFFRLDDTNVPKFTILDHTQTLQTPEITSYPKAGQPNPILQVGIAHVADGTVTWADLSKYDPKDLLACKSVGFTPDHKHVYFYAQNRTQTWLDLVYADVDTGKTKVLFRDQTKAWIRDNGVIGNIKFQNDGSFVWNSERSGFKAAYRYSAEGELKNQLTKGNWDLQQLHHIDEATGWVYFSANKDATFGSRTYRVKLDGTGLEALNKAGDAMPMGSHDVAFSPHGKYFIDQWSDYSSGPRMTLHRPDGTRVRTVQTALVEPQAKQAGQPKSGFFKIKTETAGIELPAAVQLPANIDPSKKYPVWLEIYGGPHMPQVSDKGGKGGGNDKTKQGYISFRMDPRASSSTPHISWACYKQLGVQEIKDVELSLKWLLETYPFADAKRIGISGHSHGGFMSAYALTHSKMFAAGINCAGPTDWRNYNSFYVDRYMTTPRENVKGYEAASVVAAAKNLHGKLLILHGMMDDNVHMTSAIQLADALQRANLDFDLQLYPHGRHGISGKENAAHYNRVQNEFMKRVLQP